MLWISVAFTFFALLQGSSGQHRVVDTTPSIHSVSPLYGPEAGGTRITLRGNHLSIWADSTVISLSLGDQAALCETELQLEDKIIAVTPPKPVWAAVGEKLQVKGIYTGSDEFQFDQDFEFEYRDNPVINSVYPQEAIAQGKIKVTFSGEFLDSVAHPIMVTTAVVIRTGRERNPPEFNITEETFYTECDASDPENLRCLTPNVEKYRRLLSTQSNKTDTDATAANITFHLALELEGVKEFHEELERELAHFVFVADPPAMQHWDDVHKYNGGDRMTIHGQEGEDMTRGCMEADYVVTVGLGYCEELELTTDSLSCKLPEEQPDTIQNTDANEGELHVFVLIGNHKEFIGYIKYKGNDHTMEWAMSGTGAVLIIMFVAAVVCVYKRQTHWPRPSYQTTYREQGPGRDPEILKKGIAPWKEFELSFGTTIEQQAYQEHGSPDLVKKVQPEV